MHSSRLGRINTGRFGMSELVLELANIGAELRRIADALEYMKND